MVAYLDPSRAADTSAGDMLAGADGERPCQAPNVDGAGWLRAVESAERPLGRTRRSSVAHGRSGCTRRKPLRNQARGKDVNAARRRSASDYHTPDRG